MRLARPPDVLGRNGPVAGAFWVILSTALLAGLAAFAKAAAQAGVHPIQVVFFRNVFAAIVFAPLLLVRGPALFHSGQLRLYGWRCALALFAMLTWFSALTMIPLGELTAISFLTPLFGTIGAVLFLGEIVRGRRWTALVIGFLGAMIILRPAGTSFGWGQMLALASTIAGGFTAVLVKQLTQRDDPNKIVFLTHLILAPMSLLPALFVWQWPSLSIVPLLLGMGICATLGHVTLVRGYAATDASLALTFDFAKLPFAVAIAYAVFGESIDYWTWFGALIIFSSAAYVTRREAQLKAVQLHTGSPTPARAKPLQPQGLE